MPITRLVVGDFRNLERVELRPGRVSFISGANGSGKTSLLEAISTLALGRSFRTRKFRNLIRFDRSELHLFCEFEQQGLTQRLGAVRTKSGESHFKLNDYPVSSALELASVLPCQLINSHSFSLLEGGPGERRHFLDWLVFHVKPEFRRWWGEYARCLKQRNSLLRSGKMQDLDLSVWNQALATAGEHIDQLRCAALELLLQETERLMKQEDRGVIREASLSMSYQPGWDRKSSLIRQLEEHLTRDLSLGHTTLGPHKADIKVSVNHRPAAEVLSRGQLKSLIVALYIAQIRVFLSCNPNSCLLLVDDLPAEVDQDSLRRLCEWFSQLENVQLFITGINLEDTLSYWPTHIDKKLFHVKQGQITEQTVFGANP
jgi:DNA replication and repair protein RecF